MDKLKEINVKNKNPNIEYIYWEDLKVGDSFPSGETVTMIADWEERPCYELKNEGCDESLIISDEHILKVDIFDPDSKKLENFTVLGDELLVGWSTAEDIFNYIKNGCKVFSKGKPVSISIYANGYPQKVRCIQTNKGTYEINGFINHNTYLFNYLLSKFIKPDELIGLVEEFGELIPPNDMTLRILTPPAKPNEKPMLRFVTEQSNLMRLDAVYVGEVKGEEAWPFVVNLASGTRGGCSIHGETAAQALNRLRALCELSGYNSETINEFIAKSIKYVIVMKKKNIQAIYKLTGTHNKNNFAMEEVYS